MALVDMKCPNCGAPMHGREGRIECEYCGSLLLEFSALDGVEHADVVSVDEFKKRMEESKCRFAVDFGGTALCDVDAEILKGKLRFAEEELRAGRAYKVDGILKGVPATVFAAERLRLLAEVGAADETELAAYAGEITAFSHYATMTDAATEQTRETYAYIADVCRQNAAANAEIGKGKEMLAVKMYSEGAEYAARMVAKYPTHARAWELLMHAKCLADAKYNPFDDLAKMKLCPDAAFAVTGGEENADGIPGGISDVVAERCRNVLAPAKARRAFLSKYVVVPLLTLAGIGILVGIWQLIERLVG